jgi:hypothetical protein
MLEDTRYKVLNIVSEEKSAREQILRIVKELSPTHEKIRIREKNVEKIAFWTEEGDGNQLIETQRTPTIQQNTSRRDKTDRIRMRRAPHAPSDRWPDFSKTNDASVQDKVA